MTRCLYCGAERDADQCIACGLTSAAAEVMLRRKLDYEFPNQRAEVFVAEDKPGQDESQREWKPAGIWYLAGSNTCVYSNPKDELGATQHNIQTSNRRFRDDEFLLPRDKLRRFSGRTTAPAPVTGLKRMLSSKLASTPGTLTVNWVSSGVV